MTDENLSKQVDEIEALSAIYPDEWKSEDEAFRTYSAAVTENGKTATLLITLPTEYPTTSPPLYLLTAPWMKSDDRDEISNQLEKVYVENMGESILHLWIEVLRDFLRLNCPEEDKDPVILNDDSPQEPFISNLQSPEECPFIISSEPFTERKSTFQGHVALVNNLVQVKAVIAKLYENRKISQATHNMYAYRITDDSKMWIQDCEDDGETHAGGRLLHLLQILDVKNVLVVVSRWFGGVLLGGDRFKLINNAARDALELGGYVQSSATKATTDDVKKKTKKGKNS